MPTTKTKPATTGDETVDQRKARIAELRQQLKQEQAALKEVQPKQSPLEREMARQAAATTRLDYLLSKMLGRRVQAGQAREAAIDNVTALCRQVLEAHEEQRRRLSLTW
jgi:hypothetical protein